MADAVTDETLDQAVSFVKSFAKNTGATDIGYITIDVNDEEEPNIFGKDWYTIPISANGINY